MGSYFFSHAQKRKQALLKAQLNQEAYEQLQRAELASIQAHTADYHDFDALVFSLEQDVKALKNLGKSEEKRSKLKQEILPRYQPHIEAYCKQDEVYANPVLVRMMIWFFDAGDIHHAIKYGLVAIEQKQQTPSSFNRDLPTFFTDALKDWAQSQQSPLEREQAIYFMLSVVDHVRGWPIHDAAKMNFLKSLGVLFDQTGTPENQRKALLLFTEAKQYGNPKCKTRVEKLIKMYGSPPTGAALVSMTDDRDQPDLETESEALTLSENDESASQGEES